MAKKYKTRVSADKLDAKIEQQKEALEKAKARYEAEKDALAAQNPDYIDAPFFDIITIRILEKTDGAYSFEEKFE